MIIAILLLSLPYMTWGQEVNDVKGCQVENDMDYVSFDTICVPVRVCAEAPSESRIDFYEKGCPSEEGWYTFPGRVFLTPEQINYLRFSQQ